MNDAQIIHHRRIHRKNQELKQNSFFSIIILGTRM